MLQSSKHLKQIAYHNPVFLDVKCNEFEPWGRFYWKFNRSFLTDNCFVEDIHPENMSV